MPEDQALDNPTHRYQADKTSQQETEKERLVRQEENQENVMPGKPRGKYSRWKEGSAMYVKCSEGQIKHQKWATVFGNINIVDDLNENSVRGVVWTNATES